MKRVAPPLRKRAVSTVAFRQESSLVAGFPTNETIFWRSACELRCSKYALFVTGQHPETIFGVPITRTRYSRYIDRRRQQGA